jgi:photosystem II stability/assembly factor-like uncharacterized protein
MLALTIPCWAAWEPVGPFGGSAQSITIDSRRPEVLLAGGRSGLLFRSLDRGQNWRRIPFGVELAGNVQTVRIDPEDSNHYLVGVSSSDANSAGLWESHDQGAHWTRTLSLAIEALALRASFTAVGTQHGLYARKGGEGWVRVSPPSIRELEDITAVALDPRDEQVLYAGTPHLPWKTTDGGRTWASIKTGMIDDSDVFSIALDAASPDHVLASACSGIYSSSTAGAAWKLIDGIPRSSRRTHIIAQDPFQPRTLYAGSTAGLYKSIDNGAKWTRLNSVQINGIAFDPADSRTLYLATEHAGIQVTHDGGSTLRASNDGFYSRNVQALSAGWVATAYDGELFRPVDDGWEAIASPSSENLAALAGGKYAATSKVVYELSDGVWKALKSPSTFPIRALAVLADGRLAVGTSRGLFYREANAEWTQADIDDHLRLPIESIHVGGRTIAVRTEFGVFLSRDEGAKWTEWRAAPTSIYGLAVSCDGGLLVALPQGLTRGIEGAAVEGIPGGTVSAVAFHPTRCNEAYAAQFGVVYISHDGGARWSRVEDSTAYVEQLEVLGNSLLAVFRGQGLFRR